MASREPGMPGSPNFPWIGPAIIGAGMTVASNIWSAKEAQKNREFQERMASTQAQRGMRDLEAAGINPLLAGRFQAGLAGGAQGQIEDIGRGAAGMVGTATQVRMANAQMELLRSQANQADANAVYARTQAADISNTAAAGRLELISIQRDLANQEYKRVEATLPTIIARAKEELTLTQSNVKATQARTLLDQLEVSRGKNLDRLQRQLQELGAVGPWVNVLLEYFRSAPRR